MPRTSFFLPPELVALIIEHLSGRKKALRRCALVSRTWSHFSQRTLFRDIQIHVYTYKKTARLLNDLRSLPHLQTLIRGLAIHQSLEYSDDMWLLRYMHCIVSLPPLLPNLTRIAFFGDIERAGSYHCDMPIIPHLSGNVFLVELEVTMFSAAIFDEVFEVLAATNIKRVTLTGVVPSTSVVFEATQERLHLPFLEHIRFGVEGLEEEFHSSLIHYFDLPNLKQLELVIFFEDSFFRWQELLLLGFPPLELYKLELTSDVLPELINHESLDALPLAYLSSKHVHLSLTCSKDLHVDTMRQVITWWSLILRALSNSEAPIHVEEITFSFTDLEKIDSLQSACQLLDDSLANSKFSAIKSIHFEHRKGFIDIADAVADKTRSAFPQLTIRGVLHFD